MSGFWLVARPRPLSDMSTRPRSLARIGGWVRCRLGQRLPSIEHVSDLVVGGSIVVGPALVAVALPLVFAPFLAVCGLGLVRERRRRRDDRHALTVGLADVLDQLALAVGAGLTLPAALAAVVPWVPVGYRPILADSLRRLDAGSPLVDVIAHLSGAVPHAGRRALAVLSAAVRDGTPVGPSLLLAAEEARRARRRMVEADVRRLPVLLLLPLVTCVLPAFVLLTLVPLVLGSLDGLQLPGS